MSHSINECLESLDPERRAVIDQSVRETSIERRAIALVVYAYEAAFQDRNYSEALRTELHNTAMDIIEDAIDKNALHESRGDASISWEDIKKDLDL
jgi:hypothetical protein